MSKKNNGDKSLVMSSDYFNSLTKIDLNNISSFFGFESIFFIIESNGKSNTVIRTIIIDRQYIKGDYFYRFYWDSSIKECIVKISKNETDDDFKERIESFRKILKDGIKKGILYAKKIA